MADYSDFAERFALFSDLDIVQMQHDSRKVGDMEFVKACMIELGRREKAGEPAKSRWDLSLNTTTGVSS